MAKLTIEIEENEFALWDVRATLNGRKILESENYTSENVALERAYEMVAACLTVTVHDRR